MGWVWRVDRKRARFTTKSLDERTNERMIIYFNDDDDGGVRGVVGVIGVIGVMGFGKVKFTLYVIPVIFEERSTVK